ncbi:MAG: site-specific integrase [Cellvibrionaceae bacterium]
MTKVVDAPLVPETRCILSLDGTSYDIVFGKDFPIFIEHVGNDTFRLDWLQGINTKLQQPLFNCLTDLLSTHSKIYASTMARAGKFVSETADIFNDCPIGLSSISSYINSNANPRYCNYLRPLLRRMLELDPTLFTKETQSFLGESIKWEQTDNAYFRLITNCPESGALTDQELHNLHGALNQSYSKGEISQLDFTLVWMLIGTGLRPIQIARMRRSDVQIHDGPEGKEAMLNVPLAKGEGENTGEYWLRRAPSVLAEALITYLNNQDGDAQAPLFFETSGEITRSVVVTCSKLNTWSERLGTRIPITPYRFRYTMATRALAQGASDWEVARLLTHRSTSCIQFYRASMPELLQPIQTAIGKEMAYFARAFQGRLINNLSEATRKDDGEAEIMDFVHLTQGASLGACGTRAACYQHAPIACLSCALFEPFKDAPWEELLNSLQDDATKENEDRIRLINFNAMSAVNEIIAQRNEECVDG